MSSLQHRLHLGLATSVVLLMGMLWWLVGGAMQKLGEELVLSRLVHDGESVLAALNVNTDGDVVVTPGRMAAIYQRPVSGHYFVVRMDNRRTIFSRSLWDEPLLIPTLPVGQTRQWQAEGPSGQKLLIWSGAFRKQGQQFTVAVAEDLTPLFSSLVRFNWYFAGLTLLTLCILLFIQRLIVRRSFRSVEKIRQEIKNLQQGATGELTEDVPTEVQPLVREINYLLRLFAERLQRSRNALGNLAHGLKTPLNLLSQLSRKEALQNLPDISQDLNQNTETIRQLIDRELKRSRLVGQGAPGMRFSPHEELPVLIDMLQRIYDEKGLDIQWQAPNVVFMLDRDDMLELLGNLLENACKWADRRVICRLQGEGKNLQLEVDDDGPGCSQEEIETLAKRGVRIDESPPGHGLGLAIVRDIVDFYNGELVLKGSTILGGLQACVTIGDISQH